MASRCVASSIIDDQETLDQIQLNNCEFYGDDDSSGEELSHDSSSSEEAYSSHSEDEASIRQMSMPPGSAGCSAAPDDGDEDALISTEFEKGCGCDEKCYKQFSVSEISDFRLSMKELSKNERDFFLMGKLQLLIRDPGTVSHARSSKAVKKQRLSAKYAFDHRLVCQRAFCFIHDIRDFTLRALRKHIVEAGPVTREHGSKGRKAHNAYPFEPCSRVTIISKLSHLLRWLDWSIDPTSLHRQTLVGLE